MGFNHLHCQKVTVNTSNARVEEAMNWLLSHMDDPDMPLLEETQCAAIDQSKVETLLSFGFPENVARKVGDIEKATYWILNNLDTSKSDMDATTSSTTQTPADAGLPDGGRKIVTVVTQNHYTNFSE